jgi:hypothetical protein
MYCAEAMEEMLYSYVNAYIYIYNIYLYLYICIFIYIYVYLYGISPQKKSTFFQFLLVFAVCMYIYIIIYIDIEEIQGTESPKSRKIQQVMIIKNIHYFLIKTMHLEKLAKGTPLGWFPPQIMCMCIPN